MISLQKRLARITHRHAENDQDPLLSILAGDTEESADGFGIISEASFSRFLRDIPHLFLDGATLVNEIDWIAGHIFAQSHAKHRVFCIHFWRNRLMGISLCAGFLRNT